MGSVLTVRPGLPAALALVVSVGLTSCRWNGGEGVEVEAAHETITTVGAAADDTVSRSPGGPPAPGPLTASLDENGFAENAFPPTMPDTEWHRAGWVKDDCMRCHETGVDRAPRVEHRGLPSILLEAKCRTCHVLIPGQKPRGAKSEEDGRFAPGAFPPPIPNSGSHVSTWTRDDCLLCHDSGIKGAPVVRHEGLPEILMRAKCRTCHVQVRAIESDGI